MPEFTNFSTEQLIEKRLQIHEELGQLLIERIGLSDSTPRFYGPNGEADDTGYFERLIAVEEAIDVCTRSIPKIWAHLKYRDVKDGVLNELERKMYSNPEDATVHQLEIVAVSVPGEDSNDPEYATTFSVYELQPEVPVSEQQAA